MKITKDMFDTQYADYYEICGCCSVQSCLHGSKTLPGNERERIGHDQDSSDHQFVRSYTVAYTDSILVAYRGQS